MITSIFLYSIFASPELQLCRVLIVTAVDRCLPCSHVSIRSTFYRTRLRSFALDCSTPTSSLQGREAATPSWHRSIDLGIFFIEFFRGKSSAGLRLVFFLYWYRNGSKAMYKNTFLSVKNGLGMNCVLLLSETSPWQQQSFHKADSKIFCKND